MIINFINPPSSGGGSGDYLPLTGGTLTGGITINEFVPATEDSTEFTKSILYNVNGISQSYIDGVGNEVLIQAGCYGISGGVSDHYWGFNLGGIGVWGWAEHPHWYLNGSAVGRANANGYGEWSFGESGLQFLDGTIQTTALVIPDFIKFENFTITENSFSGGIKLDLSQAVNYDTPAEDFGVIFNINNEDNGIFYKFKHNFENGLVQETGGWDGDGIETNSKTTLNESGLSLDYLIPYSFSDYLGFNLNQNGIRFYDTEGNGSFVGKTTVGLSGIGGSGNISHSDYPYEINIKIDDVTYAVPARIIS